MCNSICMEASGGRNENILRCFDWFPFSQKKNSCKLVFENKKEPYRWFSLKLCTMFILIDNLSMQNESTFHKIVLYAEVIFN